MNRKAIVLSMFLVSSCDVATSEVSEPIIDYGAAALQRTWMKTSHNTYEASHTQGSLITSHFGSTTYHIELDLRDTSSYAAGGALTGNWVVAHDSAAASATVKCGSTASLSNCLFWLRSYHLSHYGHPLITVWLDKKQDWQNLNGNTSSRSPFALDALISSNFADAELLRPADLLAYGTVRATVEAGGWPSHASLANRFMFVMTSDANCTGNDRLEAYVNNRGSSAKVFIAPSGEAASYVTTAPRCFAAAPTGWVAIYNFEWVDGNNDGECDGAACYQVPTAHDRNYLTRAWDIDDSVEADVASARPWGGSYGHVNFIAVDFPWQVGGAGGYGSYPDGVYPW